MKSFISRQWINSFVRGLQTLCSLTLHSFGQDSNSGLGRKTCWKLSTSYIKPCLAQNGNDTIFEMKIQKSPLWYHLYSLYVLSVLYVLYFQPSTLGQRWVLSILPAHFILRLVLHNSNRWSIQITITTRECEGGLRNCFIGHIHRHDLRVMAYRK